jgi:hypothetical protein
MYLAKFTSSGTALWAKNAGGVTVGANSAIGYSAVTDDTDNIYVTGHFTSATITFGAFTLTNTNAPSTAMFLVKYDASGTAVWAKQSVGGVATGKSVDLDTNGNIYVAGWIFDTVLFGNLSLTSMGLADALLMKYDAMGNEVWANLYGSSEGDYGMSITLDEDNRIYTTGYFNGTVDFNSGAGVNQLVSAGSADIFLLKSNDSGNYVWSQSMGGTLHDRGDALAVDNLGIIYVTGIFTGTCDFDPGAPTYNLVSLGFSDVFISRLGACPNSEKPVITLDDSNPETPVLMSSNPNGNQWFKDYTAIPGETNKSYPITEPGLYTVRYVTAGCESPMSEPYNIVITATEKESKQALFCAPNPAKDFITIYTPENITALTSVSIYSMTGQLMMHGGTEHLNSPLQISHYPEGIYIIRVIGKDNVTTKKFIKY